MTHLVLTGYSCFDRSIEIFSAMTTTDDGWWDIVIVPSTQSTFVSFNWYSHAEVIQLCIVFSLNNSFIFVFIFHVRILVFCWHFFPKENRWVCVCVWCVSFEWIEWIKKLQRNLHTNGQPYETDRLSQRMETVISISCSSGCTIGWKQLMQRICPW